VSLLSNWFVRIALALTIVALLAFDGIEIVVAHVGGKDDANNAAYAAAQSWQTTHDVSAVFQAAKAAVPSRDHVVGCTATSPDGQTWRCTLTRSATTVLLGRLGFMKQVINARETGSGSYQP
jgi:hypothetical protein